MEKYLIARTAELLGLAADTIESQRKEIERLRVTADAYRTLSIAVHLGDPDRHRDHCGTYSVDLGWQMKEAAENLKAELGPKNTECDADKQEAAEQQKYGKVRFDVEQGTTYTAEDIQRVWKQSGIGDGLYPEGTDPRVAQGERDPQIDPPAAPDAPEPQGYSRAKPAAFTGGPAHFLADDED